MTQSRLYKTINQLISLKTKFQLYHGAKDPKALHLYSIDTSSPFDPFQGGVQQLTAVEEPKSDLEHRVFELQQRNEQLEVEKAQLEQELDQLKIQVGAVCQFTGLNVNMWGSMLKVIYGGAKIKELGCFGLIR